MPPWQHTNIMLIRVDPKFPQLLNDHDGIWRRVWEAPTRTYDVDAPTNIRHICVRMNKKGSRIYLGKNICPTERLEIRSRTGDIHYTKIPRF